jgi:GNAT superfamily N-acetyltransferase
MTGLLTIRVRITGGSLRLFRSETTMMTDPDPTTFVRQAGDALIGLYRHAPGFEARLTRDTWLIASGEPHPQLNWIAVFARGPAAETALRDHVAAVRARGLPAIVFLTPAAGPACASLCRSLGLIAAEPAPVMICRLNELPPPRTPDGIEIAPIRDAATYRAGLDVLAAAFGIPAEPAARATPEDVLTEPPLTLYAARCGGAVAAVTAISRSGNLAYVDFMATASAYRRRGIGSALLTRVLVEQMATGATLASLVASEAGRRLYERLGFHLHFEASIWEVPPTLATDPRCRAPDPSVPRS